MNKLKKIAFFIFLLIFSCKQSDKKDPFKLSEKPNSKAIVIFKKANAILNSFGNDPDSLIKVNKLIDSALQIDSASFFVISKIIVLRKQGERKQISQLCDYLIKKNKLWFYPYYLKGNNYEYLNQTDLANNSYSKAIEIITSQNKISCDDLNYLMLISLVRKNQMDVTLYSKELEKDSCKNAADIQDVITHFNRADYLENN